MFPARLVHARVSGAGRFFSENFDLFREQFLVSFLMTFWSLLGSIFDPFPVIFASLSGTFRLSDFVSIFKWFLDGFWTIFDDFFDDFSEQIRKT